MKTANIIVTVILALAALASASGKLRKSPPVVETLTRVGVKANQIPVLAVLEILGAAGILIGLGVQALGIAAAAGLVLYFLGAVVAHLKVKDPAAALAPALGLSVVAIATLILQIGR